LDGFESAVADSRGEYVRNISDELDWNVRLTFWEREIKATFQSSWGVVEEWKTPRSEATGSRCVSVMLPVTEPGLRALNEE